MRCRSLVFFSIFCFSDLGFCYLTSDFAVNYGVANYRLNAGRDDLNLTSTYLIDFSYNLNQENINTVFFVNFNEAPESSQGVMAYTHLGFGFRVYPLGINGERTILDSTTEGRILRPSPFVGSSLGVTNFSVQKVNDTTGYFNAVGFDVSIHTGVEVVLTPDVFFSWPGGFGPRFTHPKSHDSSRAQL